MCQELKIKIATIRRVTSFAPKTKRLEWIGCMLGVDVSESIVKYVNLATDRHILRDINEGLLIAIELDNLKLNWGLTQ